jgi:hypothetical protein
MRKNMILLIGATILLLIVVYIIFSKYREPLSNKSRKQLLTYFILSPSSTPSPLTDDERIKYVNAIGINDSKYTNVLKSDLTNTVKVEKIKELLAKESD